MTESVPEGYEITGDKIVNTKTKEWFFIRNRSFKGIDHSFRHIPSKIISQLTRLPHEGRIKILDVGGGSESKSSSEIVKKYKPFVMVINADLIAKGEEVTNLYKVSSDMFKLPFADETFDFIYTRQVLTYFDAIDRNDKNLLKEKSVLAEIARVLKTGGVAIVDEVYFSRLPKDHSDLKDLGKNLSVVIDQKESGFFLSANDRLQKIIDPEFFPLENFLIMEKGKLKDSIKRILDRTPRKLPSWKSS